MASWYFLHAHLILKIVTALLLILSHTQSLDAVQNHPNLTVHHP